MGLVLGGGGVFGFVYHAAALAALEIDLGWDARDASIVVGTSAGAIVGGLLRRGVPGTDLAALSVGAEPTRSPPWRTQPFRVDAQPALAPPLPTWRLPRLPDTATVLGWVTHPSHFDPVAALIDTVAGDANDTTRRRLLAETIGTEPPNGPLWICATRRTDLRSVVFGNDGHRAAAPLPDAIAASCSVPGFMPPVVIDGVSYIDGGVRSATNASVLAGADLDVVVVLSPMSTPRPGWAGPSAWIRQACKAALAREVATLHRAGVATIVLEPSAELAEAVGLDFMSTTRRHELLTRSFFDVGTQLCEPRTRALLVNEPSIAARV